MLFPIPDIVVVSTKSAIVLSVFAGPIIFNNWYLLGWGSMPRCHNSLLNCHFLVHRTCWRDDGEFMEPDVNRSSTFGEQRLKRERERERWYLRGDGITFLGVNSGELWSAVRRRRVRFLLPSLWRVRGGRTGETWVLSNIINRICTGGN